MDQQSSICYVIMPFAAEYLPTFEKVIQPAVVAASSQLPRPLTCIRGDQIPGPGSITREIVGCLYRAQVVVADLTDSNPNVFYELGIAHCLGNKAVMIARDTKAIPFDVAAYRVHLYDLSDGGAARASRELAGAIVQVCKGTELPTNPFQDFAPIRHSELIASWAAVAEIERSVEKEIWLITPTNDADLKIFGPVVRDNLANRGITYKYILPNTTTAQRGWRRLLDFLALDDDALRRLQVRWVDEHQIESEVVIYDPYCRAEHVMIMSPLEDEVPFHYQLKGTRANRIRQRFEELWDNLAKEQPSH